MNNTNGRRILGAGITLALVLCARSPLAQENPSARISALGGLHVSGIIPDLYTDLTVNPANAVFADKLSINYDRRGVAGFTLDIPNLGSGGRSSPSDSYFANEVSVWGLKLSSWRAAIFAQWRLGQSEHNTHDYYIYNSTDVRSRQQWGSSDGDIGRIDLIAARALGDHSAFGARLQIRGYYLSSSDAGVSEENYYFDNMIYVQPQTTYKSNDASSLSGRKLSVDVQAGLLKRDDGESRTEVALEASVHPLDYKKQTVSLDIREQYNPAAQLTNYDYSRIEWSDDREGNLWALGLFAGHTFGSGIRLYAGASVSTASYDAAWNRSQQAYEWSGSDEILSGAFSCDGSMRGASCFLKGGRKFELGDNLDLYLGLHGAFEWNHAEEDPVIRYTQAHRDDTGSVVIDQPSTLEYTGKRMNLYLPLSIEFRPSSYFSVFSGFTIAGGWHKSVWTQPLQAPFSYSDSNARVSSGRAVTSYASPAATVYPEESVASWESAWNSGSSLTLGFSLHYRDRFFIDVYTDTDIIPQYLADNLIDVRYVF